MNVNEQPMVSDYFDKNGVKEGDRIFLNPLMGRKTNFLLNRTCIDFISSDLERSINSPSYRVLGSQKTETFHVQIYIDTSNGRNNVKKRRYMVNVLIGAPVKLNGVYILQGYLEENDNIEIGFNKLQMKRNVPKLDFDPQQKMISENKKIVRSKLPLLIEGETGVGKTSLAYKIHADSERQGRFVHINLASYTPSLIESELFGHVKGAFTGAINSKRGAFKEADMGTLFIDEIDSLPIDIQTKLLLFLDDFKARPVGGEIDYQVDLRIIFSSGSKLKHLVQMGKMRKDFFFRISSGHSFSLKPLRDEPELIRTFCNLYIIKNNISISEKLIEFYQSLPWPGNYRQLKGHLERKQILGNSSKISFDENDEHLLEQSSELIGINNEPSGGGATLNEVKVSYVMKVYYQCEKNYTHAAGKLGISTRSLRNIVKQTSQKTYEPTI